MTTISYSRVHYRQRCWRWPPTCFWAFWNVSSVLKENEARHGRESRLQRGSCWLLLSVCLRSGVPGGGSRRRGMWQSDPKTSRSEEATAELQSHYFISY